MSDRSMSVHIRNTQSFAELSMCLVESGLAGACSHAKTLGNLFVAQSLEVV